MMIIFMMISYMISYDVCFMIYDISYKIYDTVMIHTHSAYDMIAYMLGR